NSRPSHLVALATVVLFCFSFGETLGEHEGSTPPENAVPSSKKDDVKKKEPEKVLPQRDKNIPTKSKNGQKPRARDTLAPKIALS
ncbi:unnamed protein product, partial [Scytosiphon promiscuus]